MEQTIKDTLQIIFGGKPASYYLAGLFFSILAILLSLYHSSKKRDPLSPSTPFRFSWWFLIWDNCKRAGATLIVMFILFRALDLSEVWGMIGVGFAVSLFLDKLIEWLMKRSEIICKLLGMDRDNFPQKPQ